MRTRGKFSLGIWTVLSVMHLTQVQCLPLVVTSGRLIVIDAAWQSVVTDDDPVNAAVVGTSACELAPEQCDYSVGYGAKPDETGQVSLDAMIMDGKAMKAGCIGFLRRAKNAIRVAHAVLKHTTHTLLVGDGADKFAKDMGFADEDLMTNATWDDWQHWQERDCQPNKWIPGGVQPPPDQECGPYRPVESVQTSTTGASTDQPPYDPNDHDTIGVIVVDSRGNIATGTSTNGLHYKMHGRVGDSPIPGAGSYCENGVGGAVATGNGDVMLRLLPTFDAVQRLREGKNPQEAAELSMMRMARIYQTGFGGKVVVADVHGNYGAACFGYKSDTFYVRSENSLESEVKELTCISDVTDAGTLTKGGLILVFGLHLFFLVFS